MEKNSVTGIPAKQQEAKLQKLEKYQKKVSLLQNVFSGKTPVIIYSGDILLQMKDGLCTIRKCDLSGNIMEKCLLQGMIRLSRGRIFALEMKNHILELFVPVYFKGGTLQQPEVDQKRSLKEGWNANKKLLLTSGVKNLQQQYGKYITIDGKKLSDMTEQEAVEKAEKTVKKKLDSFLWRLERKKKKKKEK